MILEPLLLYRDALILVIDKPHGIPVHKGSGPLIPLDHYFDQLMFGLPKRPELTHRLDKDTSGCLVLGRHAQALRRMGKLFEKQRVEKIYRAIVCGHVQADHGIIDLPLSPQDEHKHHWHMRVDEAHGKPAVTHFRVLHRFEHDHTPFSFVELSPKTGRTHQLRVHCKAMGHAIQGDPIYGDDTADRLMLHAWRVIVPLYPKRDPLCITAPLHDKSWNVGGYDPDQL